MITRSFLTWLRYVLIASAVVFTCAATATAYLIKSLPAWQAGLYAVGLLLCIASFSKLAKPITSEKSLKWFGRESLRQTNFLEKLPAKSLLFYIFASAALSLLLELSLIRWQASSVDFLAFFKNFGLIACFAGLGLGYSLSAARTLPLFSTIILVGYQIFFVSLLQFSTITNTIASPPTVGDQHTLRVALVDEGSIAYWLAVYLILALLFCLTSLAFLPIGQLCGKLMGRLNALPAYGANLLGSLFGVITMTVLSYFWTPPIVWLGLCLFGCLLFGAYGARSLILGGVVSIVALVLLGLPTRFAYSVVHSPYQIIEVEPADVHGWLSIKAAGYYYQRVLDLSEASINAFTELKLPAAYYNMPYKIHPGAKNVLIIGAGSGNDVSAALRAGVEHVDAVEIDPAIAEFGRLYHPEEPYKDKRVNLVLNDGRAFLRKTHSKYDIIVYALIDSHALSSSSSSLRVDSYIYTVESFKEAREHLAPHGLFSMSFVGVLPDMQAKITKMLKMAYDGQSPLTLMTLYDTSSNFLESADGKVEVPPEVDLSHYMVKRTDLDPNTTAVDESTDNWPFFYMPHRRFPVSYLPLIVLVLSLSVLLVRTMNKAPLSLNYMPFFWLGVGFMLVETKAITELGLQFGNTWLVTSIVVASVISMAFVSNLIVEKVKLNNLILPAILLIGSLAASAYVCHLGHANTLNEWAMTAILTCPIVFSGVIFSILLSKVEDIGSAMSMNIIGALCGGLLEYNALYLGYESLYYFAIAIYLMALVSLRMKKPAT
ncbi:MAG: hypothetical protein JST89_24495 [Cyanobacteria bacterium SZAS-4]|nr:hypothetical protein [Cyanobacteria bacterium SZAS-4]